MAADSKIEIQIATTGAQETARAIGRVEDEVLDLGQASSNAAATGMQPMADKARAAEVAFNDLDSELAKTNTTVASFSSGQTQVAASSRNSAQALLMFSQGIEDAQYGIRGVLNNIPGLIFAMGGGAGLAGAISLAAVGLSQIIPLFTETEEKAGDMADRIDEIATNAGELEVERFEQFADAIDAARDRTEALKQEFDDTRAAEREFATSALDNAGKLAEAQRNVAESLGRQVNSYKELQDIAAAEEEKRNLAAQQAIEAERQKLAAQEETTEEAGQYLARKREQAALEEANLVNLRAQLDALKQQKSELESLVQLGAASRAAASAAAMDGVAAPDGTFENIRRGADAARQLADPALAASIAAAEERISQMEAAVETLTKDGGVITKAENAFLAAQTQLTDLTTAVGTNIQRIQDSLAAENLLARTQTVATAQEQQAKDLAVAVSNIETSNEIGRQAKTTLQAAAADGKITADESANVARATTQIIGQIQAGLATAGNNTQQVLGILRTVAQQEARNAQAIQQLQAQINQLYARIR